MELFSFEMILCENHVRPNKKIQFSYFLCLIPSRARQTLQEPIRVLPWRLPLGEPLER